MDVSAVNNTADYSYKRTDSKGELTQQDFLNLMITQLKYQDPLEPMDTATMSEQLVQYSTLSEAQKTNEKLDMLLDAGYGLQDSLFYGFQLLVESLHASQWQNDRQTAVSLMGKEISYETNGITRVNVVESVLFGEETRLRLENGEIIYPEQVIEVREPVLEGGEEDGN